MKLARLAFALLLALPILPACSGSPPTTPAAAGPGTAVAVAPKATPPSASAATTPVPGGPRQACNLVTAAEMSAILGNAVVATPHDDAGVTNCSYAPALGKGSSVDFTVMWGDGESTLKMDRDMKGHDAEADKRFAGVGDDAVVVAPAVQVRQGKDLLVLTLFGVADEPTTARKIVDTAKTRL